MSAVSHRRGRQSSKSSTPNGSPAPRASATSTSARSPTWSPIQAAFVDFGVEENGFLHYLRPAPPLLPGRRRRGDDRARRAQDPAPRTPADPALPEARPGDHRPGSQGGRGHQGPDAHQLPVHPGPLPRDDAPDGQGRCLAQGRGRGAARKMREILDQLDLPEGFGFILRTAGMDRTKARAQARPGLPAAPVEGHGAPARFGQQAAPALLRERPARPRPARPAHRRDPPRSSSTTRSRSSAAAAS
jgi:hypothetical protein